MSELPENSENPQKAVANDDLLAALNSVAAAKLDLGNSVKQAVECAVQRWHERQLSKVLPVITVKTSPEIVYGGHPRRVTAHVTVDFFR